MNKADFTVITIDPGDVVICDICGVDYTDSDEVGGLLFGSYSVCPACLPDYIKTVRKYNEERFIRARANPGETFKDFVLRIREL